MIFLIGEQEGKNLGNNGFYFWRKALEKVEAYFVVHPQSASHPILNDLTEKEQKYILEMDSKEHFEIYNKADMLFVTLSFHDVMPSYIKLDTISQPLVYLQHGTLGIKRIYYTESSYHSHIYRFLYYNKSIGEQLAKYNFEEYQLQYSPAQPRYEGLLNKQVETSEGSMLFFFTWRDNGDITEIYKMLDEIEENPNKDKITVILHDFIELDENIQYSFKILKSREVDVQLELCKCEVFVTDYSSVIWDAVAVEKKCFLWWTDYDVVTQEREFYIEKKDVANILANTYSELLSLIENKYDKDNYFYNSLQFDINKAKCGGYTSDLVDNFISIIDNKVSFVGYNFYGSGGTVTASKALARGYLNQGYLVEMMSMTRTTVDQLPVPGCVMKTIVDFRNKDFSFAANKKFEASDDFQLDYVYNKTIYNQVTEHRLNSYLSNNTFKLLISTREIMHLIVKQYESKHNIRYMFHTDYQFFKENNPQLHERFMNEEFGNGIFLSPKAREEYINNLNLKFKNTKIVPNGLFTPIRKRYNQKPEYSCNVSNVCLHGEELFLECAIKTNFDYVYSESIKNARLVIEEQDYILEDLNDSSLFPVTLEIKNTKGIKINTLLSKKPIAIVCEIDNKEIMLPIDDYTSLFKEHQIIDELEIAHGEINIKQSFMTLVESDEEYSIFKLPLNVKLDNPLFVPQIYGEDSYLQISKENYNEKIKVSKFNTFIECSFSEFCDLNNKTYIDVCSVMRVAKDRSDQLDEYMLFAKYLKENKSSIFIHVFGGGDMLNEMIRRVNMEGLESHIKFEGFSNDIQRDTNHIDTQISLSKMESFGMTYLEALSTGKRIFTYRNIGSEEMFNDYEEVFISDYEELEQKILEDNYSYFEEMREKLYPKYEINSIIESISL